MLAEEDGVGGGVNNAEEEGAVAATEEEAGAKAAEAAAASDEREKGGEGVVDVTIEAEAATGKTSSGGKGAQAEAGAVRELVLRNRTVTMMQGGRPAVKQGVEGDPGGAAEAEEGRAAGTEADGICRGSNRAFAEADVAEKANMGEETGGTQVAAMEKGEGYEEEDEEKVEVEVEPAGATVAEAPRKEGWISLIIEDEFRRELRLSMKKTAPMWKVVGAYRAYYCRPEEDTTWYNLLINTGNCDFDDDGRSREEEGRGEEDEEEVEVEVHSACATYAPVPRKEGWITSLRIEDECGRALRLSLKETAPMWKAVEAYSAYYRCPEEDITGYILSIWQR